MKEPTEEQLKQLKRWHKKVVKGCKTCGNKCLIIEEGKEK